MIYIYTALGLVIVSEILLAAAYARLSRSSRDMLASLGLELARAKDLLDEVVADSEVGLKILGEKYEALGKKFEDLSANQTNVLVDALNEQWEKATQAITNFDPFHPEGGK